MYKPDRAKYDALIDQYLSDAETRFFCAYENSIPVGIIVVRSGEILGISVREDMRRQNVGRSLIGHALKAFSSLTAETDDDSIGFYRSCGFCCKPFTRTFPDGICTRYRCELRT